MKRQLKLQGLTYRDVGLKLNLSEPSEKRLFTSGRLTAERLVELSNMLGLALAELAQEAALNESKIRTLSDSQKKELVSDMKLLLVAVCTLNHWALSDIWKTYQLSDIA